MCSRALLAVQVKEQSPRVALELKLGQLKKKLSIEFLRLYGDVGVREIRDDK